MLTQVKRLREIDFLRGLAILLVLLRHQYVSIYTFTMGWMGVDLFFVLSGFLVSGLLFKEYIKYGDIEPKRFLIRRGFKIYPIYYLFYLAYLIPLLFRDGFYTKGIISELLFVQNYTMEWGYAFFPGWSLAVEEHFYIGLSLFLWLGLKKNLISLKVEEKNTSISSFEWLLLSLMGLCFVLRLSSNLIYPEKMAHHMTMTHFRIDSLLAGVLISYLYYFRYERLKRAFSSYRLFLFMIALLGIAWTPFWDPWESLFVRTAGYSLVYISFGILLLTFLFTEDINRKLNAILSKALVNTISKIGFCSYSIYVIHALVNETAAYVLQTYHVELLPYVLFVLTSAISIGLGMLMTYQIEHYFLKLREKHYPNRTGKPAPVYTTGVAA